MRGGAPPGRVSRPDAASAASPGLPMGRQPDGGAVAGAALAGGGGAAPHCPREHRVLEARLCPQDHPRVSGRPACPPTSCTCQRAPERGLVCSRLPTEGPLASTASHGPQSQPWCRGPRPSSPGKEAATPPSQISQHRVLGMRSGGCAMISVHGPCWNIQGAWPKVTARACLVREPTFRTPRPQAAGSHSVAAFLGDWLPASPWGRWQSAWDPIWGMKPRFRGSVVSWVTQLMTRRFHCCSLRWFCFPPAPKDRHPDSAHSRKSVGSSGWLVAPPQEWDGALHRDLGLP